MTCNLKNLVATAELITNEAKETDKLANEIRDLCGKADSSVETVNNKLKSLAEQLANIHSNVKTLEQWAHLVNRSVNIVITPFFEKQKTQEKE